MDAVKRYVVAVSGGVDSVALLHMMRQLPRVELIVAHFDHGIRPDSIDDALFVSALASHYQLPFESRREELGEQASEEQARARRYAFLRDVARRHKAQLVTAHHADDVVETIAINHLRGTGWRGLAPMTSDVLRPLATMNKQALLQYARKHHLQWHEDSTNQSDKYLRNRVRQALKQVPQEKKQQLLDLFRKQQQLRRKIEQETERLVGESAYSRYFFSTIGEAPALELLRHMTNAKLTRPQLQRALLAIKTARPGNVHQAGAGVEFRFTPRHFAVELIK